MFISTDRTRVIEDEDFIRETSRHRDAVIADGFKPRTPDYVYELARRTREDLDAGLIGEPLPSKIDGIR